MKETDQEHNNSPDYVKYVIPAVMLTIFAGAMGLAITQGLSPIVPEFKESMSLRAITVLYFTGFSLLAYLIVSFTKEAKKAKKKKSTEPSNPPSPQPLPPPPPKPDPATRLPARLATPKAMAIWAKAQQAGFVTNDYQFIGSRSELSIFAGNFSIYLFGKCDWVLFKQWTQYANYAKTYSDYSKKPKDKLPERMREIQALFE